MGQPCSRTGKGAKLDTIIGGNEPLSLTLSPLRGARGFWSLAASGTSATPNPLPASRGEGIFTVTRKRSWIGSLALSPLAGRGNWQIAWRWFQDPAIGGGSVKKRFAQEG
jgi:hypothetical protein